MKFNQIPGFIFFLHSFLFFGATYSQDITSPDFATKVDSLKYIEGVSLQQGGSFTDPVSSKGLSLSSDLGLMESKQVFGYDALTFNARWVPGTNAIGSRISLQLGTANWFTPGLSEIYIDTILSEEEKFQQSVTNSVWIAGLGISILRPNVFSNGKSEDLDQAFQKYKRNLDTLHVLITNAEGNPLLVEKYEVEESRLLWKIAREHARKSRWIVGGNFRLLNLGQSANVDVLDLYSTFARGKGSIDFSASLHYLAPREKSFLFRDAITISTGVFLDLYPSRSGLG